MVVVEIVGGDFGIGLGERSKSFGLLLGCRRLMCAFLVERRLAVGIVVFEGLCFVVAVEVVVGMVCEIVVVDWILDMVVGNLEYPVLEDKLELHR